VIKQRQNSAKTALNIAETASKQRQNSEKAAIKQRQSSK